MSESVHVLDLLPDEYDYVIHITNKETQLPIIREWLETHEKEYKAVINKGFTSARYFAQLYKCLNVLSATRIGGNALRLKGASTGTFEWYDQEAKDQINTFGHELRFLEFDELLFDDPIEISELVFKTQDLFD